jgi:predicted nucleic acid-binding Zn ribbon protein
MTGFRASPMRRRVCVSCQTKFVPKRLDAVTCSNRCRMAEHRKRDAKAKAEALFKTREQITHNAWDNYWHLEHYQEWATIMSAEAERKGLKHVRFIGTGKGILAVEGLTNQGQVDDPPWGPPILTREIEHNPVNPEAGDPEVIEAVVEALKSETLGGSFVQREYEKECRALLKGAVRRIALFAYDPDWRNSSVPVGGWPSLPSFSWDDDRDDVADDGGDFNSDTKDLLAGGGYHTFKA